MYPSHLSWDAKTEPGYRWIACIHLPTGQATWHIAEVQLPLFGHLKPEPDHWDHHTTEEKYRRVDAVGSLTLPDAPVRIDP